MQKIKIGARLRLKTTGEILKVIDISIRGIELERENKEKFFANIVQVCGMCEAI